MTTIASKPLSRNTACLLEYPMDQNSTYSHIYITSVIHQDLGELRNRLKEQYSVINSTGEIPLKEYKSRKDIDNFERDIKKINLETKRDVELGTELQEMNKKEEEKIILKTEKNTKSTNFILSIINQQKVLFTLNRKLFLYCLFISFLSFSIQLIFITVLVREYYNLDIVHTKDNEQLAIRFIALFTMSLMVWIEYKNGIDKLNHAIYQSFLYRSVARRNVSIFTSLMQMIAAILSLLVCTMLIAQTSSVIDNAKSLGAILMLINVDNWIGDYFVHSNKRIKVYTREHIVQIWCYDKKNHQCLTFMYIVEIGIFFFFLLVSFYWIVKSIGYN